VEDTTGPKKPSTTGGATTKMGGKKNAPTKRGENPLEAKETPPFGKGKNPIKRGVKTPCLPKGKKDSPGTLEGKLSPRG